MKKITFILIIAIIFGACSNKTNKDESSNNDSTAVQNAKQDSSISQNTTDKKASLYDLLWELIASANFHGTIKDVDYPRNIKENSDVSGYKIIDEKPDDYIKLNLWGFGGQNDTLIFQFLKKTPDYKLYIFYNRGHNESPINFYNDIYLFKYNINKTWTEKTLLNDDYNLSYFASYNPKTKEISDFEQALAPNTLFGAVPTYLKAKYIWSADDEIFINQNIEVQKENMPPNPVLIKGNIKDSSGVYSNYIIGELDEDYYSDYIALDGKKTIKIIYSYRDKSYVGDFFSDDYNRFEKEVLKNKDPEKRFYIKYKNDGNGFKTIDDYEIIEKNKNPIIATFDHFTMGDFFHYVFITKLGYAYDFSEVNTSYLFDDENQNKKYIGKKFKIWYHSKIIDNEYDAGGKYEYSIVDSIKLLNE